MTILKAKETVRLLITYGEKAKRELELGEVIDQCNETRLLYHLRDIFKAQGGAEVLMNLLPDDKEAKDFWRQANEIHKSGNISKDRFSRECNCEKSTIVNKI